MNSRLPQFDSRCLAGGVVKSPPGFTLVEALIAVTILGFAVAGITMLLMAGMNQNYLASRYMLAGNLAHDLMDEVLAKPFYDPESPQNLTPGPEPGETSRALLDNVDDYDGLVEPTGAMQLPSGSPLDRPNLADFSRSVAAGYVYLPGQDSQADPTFILVRVEVLDNSMPMIEIKRLISSAERQVTKPYVAN